MEPDNIESCPEAAAILRDAGWKPHDQWGVYTRGTLVMGFSPDGQNFDVKNTATAADGPDTPDDPVEAARWLVRLRAVDVTADATDDGAHGRPEIDDERDAAADAGAPSSGDGAPSGADTLAHGEGGGIGAFAGASAAEADAVAQLESLFGEPAEAAYGGEDGEAEGYSPEQMGADVQEAAGGDQGDAAASEEIGGGAEAFGGVADDAEPFDADFAPVEDEPPERDALDADLIPLRGIAWDENTVADEEEAASTEGPIAYAASDLDALVREKLGRVSQIARELKATLQDGWTIDEFRSLQNLIVRIDRGEATDDAQARARFVAISERSQAMSRVDAHRDALEAALEVIGKARDYQAARDFDPEAGWP